MFLKHTNVISWKPLYEGFTWSVETNQHIMDMSNPPQYYLIIDFVFNEAFAHWVFESAIFLIHWKKLREQYPNIILVLSSEKVYKKLFLEYLEISPYTFDTSLQPNNICLFPPVFALNDLNIDIAMFSSMVKEFSFLFRKNAKKTIPILQMPRQKRENYVPNDRTISFNDIQGQILNTDDIVKLQDQIDIVSSSQNIILTYGSALFVNGMFTSDSNIIVLGNLKQHDVFPTMKCLMDNVLNYNTVHFIDSFYQKNVEPLLK